LPNKYSQEKRILNDFTNGLWKNNPLLSAGLCVASAVFVTTALKNGLALCVGLLFVTIPAIILNCLLLAKVPAFLRFPICFFLGSFMLIPASFVIAPLSPDIFDSLGIFLPLLAINAVTFSRVNEFEGSGKLLPSLMDAVGCCLGFSGVILLMSAVREVIGHKTIFSYPIGFITTGIPGFLLPFAGFIFLGFLAAIFNKVNMRSPRGHNKNHAAPRH